MGKVTKEEEEVVEEADTKHSKDIKTIQEITKETIKERVVVEVQNYNYCLSISEPQKFSFLHYVCITV